MANSFVLELVGTFWYVMTFEVQILSPLTIRLPTHTHPPKKKKKKPSYMTLNILVKELQLSQKLIFKGHKLRNMPNKSIFSWDFNF